MQFIDHEGWLADQRSTARDESKRSELPFVESRRGDPRHSGLAGERIHGTHSVRAMRTLANEGK
ncbi:MAG: hypothetical protein ABS52_16055 [Gemmatimonadetes bacterium SCN 70-22]|nr:MAG: hypothetical protein ABS52_16055 [Gemmatimonadetes bacterium SCN 70-22]